MMTMPMPAITMRTMHQQHALPHKSGLRRAAPMLLIVALHLLFFYALRSGLVKQAIPAGPQEIFVSLIAAATPTPAPPAPRVEPPTVAVRRIATPTPPVTPAVAPQALAALSTPAAPINVAPAIDTAEATATTPPVPTSPALPKTISSSLEYIQPPRPEYPAAARRLREEGKTTLRVLVDEKGHPERAEIVKSSGSTRLDDAARYAVLAALFKPHIEAGRAIAVYALVPISFSLDT
ncbi:protein TonB [Actimicrobium sp. GrIS 1.19]|uniref:energy transducer TonB n=1 Tax=Actimicrobium sp. GrIS 1.19 TaxID=3071708 RepID=UPI002E05CCFA|nr:protein TonB [Actimicrobium sp. GrIS 1.19]